MKAIFRAISRNTSAGGLGFAGTTGLVASGLTDIASSLGPFLAWFVVIAAVAALLLAFLIRRHEKQATADSKDPMSIRAYCHTFVILLGSLFGSLVLLATGFLTGNSEGSNLLALLNDVKSSVEQVGQQVGEVREGVEGLGESIMLRDISGRSGTGKIGEKAVFEVSLANNRLIDGASCRLTVPDDWQDLIEVENASCSRLTVRLPTSPVLDPGGASRGEIVAIPFELDVIGSDGQSIASYSDTYPLYNNYGTIGIVLDPSGNRFQINEEREIRVDVGDAELPDTVECEWTVFEPVSIETTSDNGCVGTLSTAVDTDSYIYKRLQDEGQIRDDIYVQLNSAADLKMLGNATLTFIVRP